MSPSVKGTSLVPLLPGSSPLNCKGSSLNSQTKICYFYAEVERERAGVGVLAACTDCTAKLNHAKDAKDAMKAGLEGFLSNIHKHTHTHAHTHTRKHTHKHAHTHTHTHTYMHALTHARTH